MRCSQSTERNPISSRSHAVCRIKIRSAELGSAAAAADDDKPAVSAAAGDTASASSAGLCCPPRARWKARCRWWIWLAGAERLRAAVACAPARSHC